MSISIRNLHAGYHHKAVLGGIDTVADGGGVTAIIGPNASGKTTLLRSILGSLRPLRGGVLIDGEPSHRMPARRLATRIAWVAQRPAVSAPFSVREVIELGRYALPRDPARIERVLERLDLRGIAGRPWGELSAGQQQRVAFARALAQLAPDGHLLLDEPTTAMDLGHVRQLLVELRGLAASGVTVILSTHDLPLAAAIADRIWMIDHGRLIHQGVVSDSMDPARLESVFGVPFAWIDAPDGRRHLVSGVADRVSSDPPQPLERSGADPG